MFALQYWVKEGDSEDLLQNDFKILAALSHSLSRVVGQKASDPILFESLLTGAPTKKCQLRRQGVTICDFLHLRLSAKPHALSNPFLLPDFVRSHEGRIEVTFCIMAGHSMQVHRENSGCTDFGWRGIMTNCCGCRTATAEKKLR